MKSSIVFLFRLFLFGALISASQLRAQEIIAIDSVDALSAKKVPMYQVDSLLRVRNLSDDVLYPKKFEKDFYTRYKDKDFDYHQTQPKEPIIDKILRYFRKVFEAIFGDFNPSVDWNANKIVIRLLVIAVVGVLLYYLLKFFLLNNRGLFFGRKNSKLKVPVAIIEENIHEINFPKSISQYELEGKFRYALRYQFLYVLKKLSDAGKIDWNPEKTNLDYAREVDTQQFRELVHVFEHVWYGEFDISKMEYEKRKQDFLTFSI